MFNSKKIISFTEIKLRISGMQVGEVYEVICRDGKAEISSYWLSYENGTEQYNLNKRAAAPESDVVDILNKFKILKWDGFYGKNPPYLLDGTMFDFTALVNGGRKISASGSNNFPKHYRDFIEALNALLTKNKV